MYFRERIVNQSPMKKKFNFTSSVIKKYRDRSFILLLLTIVMIGCDQKEVFYPELAIPNFIIYESKDRAAFTNEDLPEKGILMVKYFSPDCNHCQDEAQLLVSQKDSLQNIQTLWVSGSWANFDSIQKFIDRYRIDELNAVAIGKEADDSLLLSYKIKGIPFAAVYKDNQLLKEYPGALDLKELFSINNGTYVLEQKDSILARKQKAALQY